MATICETILILPSGEAGIEAPRACASVRSAVTANSRPMMIATIHACTRSIWTSDMNAAIVRSLSAKAENHPPLKLRQEHDDEQRHEKNSRDRQRVRKIHVRSEPMITSLVAYEGDHARGGQGHAPPSVDDSHAQAHRPDLRAALSSLSAGSAQESPGNRRGR